MAKTLPKMVFVVAREERPLYDKLVQCFAGRDNVRVVLDRRVDQRRAQAAPASVERRRSERRLRQESAEELRNAGWTVVRVDGATRGL